MIPDKKTLQSYALQGLFVVINHQQCWWCQKALAMSRKNNPPLVK